MKSAAVDVEAIARRVLSDLRESGSLKLDRGPNDKALVNMVVRILHDELSAEADPGQLEQAEGAGERYVTPSGRVTDLTPEEAYARMAEVARELDEAFGPEADYGMFS